VDDYSLEVRDTKLGNEELTNDIPNVSEEATKDLNGMIRIEPRLNLVTFLSEKLLQKENQILLEEKLLRAIFGDKAGDVKDVIKSISFFTWCCFRQKIVCKSSKDKRKRTQDKDALGALEMEFEVKFVELKTN
jgi:DNA-directed RNA polymerase subunit beta